MKKQLFLILSFAYVLVVYSVDYRTIPLARNIEMKSGFSFSLTKDVRIQIPTNKVCRQNAFFIRDFIFEKTGSMLKIVKNARKKDFIELRLDSTVKNAEGYRIDIDTKRIIISASSNAGLFYGIQTLCKSIPSVTNVQLPPAVITDEPRFAYRGAHLDVSRHFFDTVFIKRYIDILALHHINTFHWHLTDDQGWRIEIKKYPQLTNVGSKRNQTVVGHRKSGIYDGTPYGGFYTQKQIKEIVKYAAERYITIIPEIDMPGHMLAALTSYPELGCTGGPYKVAETWGIFDDVLCPGKETTFQFVENVLSEIINLFPSKYIHIGGDECLKNKWKVCPHCQLRITTEGLNDSLNHSAEDKLQSYFITRVQKFLNQKGRQIIGWEEILDGGLASNATIMSWQGIAGGVLAARQNHNVIMASNSNLYFNFYQSDNYANEPYAMGGLSTLRNVYSFNPLPPELNEKEHKYVIGAQSCLWTEYIATPELAEYMLLPRLAALSEVLWTDNRALNYDDFIQRLPTISGIYQKRGYNFAKNSIIQ